MEGEARPHLRCVGTREGTERYVCPESCRPRPVFFQQENRGLRRATELCLGPVCGYALVLFPSTGGKTEVDCLVLQKPSHAQATSGCRLPCVSSLAFFQTLFTHKCVYTGRIRSLKNGCARYCNATVKVRRVCVCLGPSPRPPRPTLKLAGLVSSWTQVCAITGGLWGLGQAFLQGQWRADFSIWQPGPPPHQLVPSIPQFPTALNIEPHPDTTRTAHPLRCL